MPPFPRSFTYPQSVPVRDHVDVDVRTAAARTGAELLDFDDVLGDDPGLRCVAGYNLNARGSRLAGERIADWLLDKRTTSGGLRDAQTRSILALNGD
jgi:hypothetical protein